MVTKVYHWRYEDGISPPNQGNAFPLDPVPRGWYCWVYPDNDRTFEKWMKAYCPTADYTHRFNSGDPMYTVFIKDAQEALIFKLQWM